MKEIKTPDEAFEWIRKNKKILREKGKLGEALNRYYKLAKKTAAEAYPRVKEMMKEKNQ